MTQQEKGKQEATRTKKYVLRDGNQTLRSLLGRRAASQIVAREIEQGRDSRRERKLCGQ